MAEMWSLYRLDEATGVVKVKLQGACGSCPMATMTLKHGIERYLKEAMPQITAVEKIWNARL